MVVTDAPQLLMPRDDFAASMDVNNSSNLATHMNRAAGDVPKKRCDVSITG